MHDWFVLGRAQDDIFALEEAVEVLPIVHFLVQLETVVVLVHFDLFRVVTRQNLGVDPPIGQIAFRVRDLVGEVERLDPLGHLAGQGEGCLHYFFSGALVKCFFQK